MIFGDIYLVEIPASVTEGREQQGLRPAIIVQTSDNIDKIPTILIIPFTTQIKKRCQIYLFSYFRLRLTRPGVFIIPAFLINIAVFNILFQSI